MKKVLSIVLTVLLVVSIIPTGLFSITASATTSDYYDYSISDGAVTINGVDESVSGDITIPSTLGGYPVTSIGDNAFWFCDDLVSVIIPDSVISIGDSAFDFCDNLTDVRIGNGVKSIGQDAFAWCGNLTNVTIGNSVTSIGKDAFYYCKNLKKVQINDIAAWCKIDFWDGSYTNPLYYAGKLYLKGKVVTSLVIPDSVTTISDYAFSDCTSLTSITIGNGVRSIGSMAFSDCWNLTDVTLGKSVTSIGDEAFSGCDKLTSITIPKSVTSIGDYAFFCYDDLKKTIYYQGSKSQKSKIDIGYGNDCLLDATWCYNSCIGNKNHKYSNSCDTTCNVCKVTRTITHTYKTVVDVKATLTKNGKAFTKCSVCGNTTSTKTTYYPKTIKLSATSYAYNGKVKTPTVTVKSASGTKLTKNKSYTVTYAKGRKNIGKYKVTIKMKGNYTGTKTLYFTVKPTTKASISLLAGTTTKIGAKSNKKITYSSSNKSIAKVDSTGKITAVKKGTATINVKSGGITSKITVKVTNPSISLSASKKSMYVGQTLQIKATKKPSSAKVTWSVSNKKLAKISSSGKLTALSNGTVTVTGKFTYKGKTYKNTYKVKITVDYPDVNVFMHQEWDYKDSYGIIIQNNGSEKLTIQNKGTVYCDGELEKITSLFINNYYSSITIPSGSEKTILLILEKKMWFYTIDRACVDIYVKYRGETFVITCWSDYDSGYVTPYEITWQKK